MRAAKPDEPEPGDGLDLGTPGASARAEYERRRARDDQCRTQVFGRILSPLIKLATGGRPATLAWDRGGRGEVVVGASLKKAAENLGYVLHDRAIPGSRSNIDHIAVVPSGVWVIDTKSHHGLVERRRLGGLFTRRPALFVNGRNRTTLIPPILRQRDLVQRVVGPAAPTHGALCFVHATWGFHSRRFTIDGVRITGERQLAGALRRSGPLSPAAIRSLASHLATAFPSYGTGPTRRPRSSA